MPAIPSSPTLAKLARRFSTSRCNYPIPPTAECQGFLYKRGAKPPTGYRQRYFVLSGSCLSYYQGTQLRGHIDLRNATIEATDVPLCFGLVVEGPYTTRRFELQANSKQDQLYWLEHLLFAANNGAPAVYTHPFGDWVLVNFEEDAEEMEALVEVEKKATDSTRLSVPQLQVPPRRARWLSLGRSRSASAPETTQTALASSQSFIQERVALFDAAQAADWAGVVRILHNHPTWVNLANPLDTSGMTLLHYAVVGGASVEVLAELLGLGADPLQKTAAGETCLMLASEEGKRRLGAAQQPKTGNLRFIKGQVLGSGGYGTVYHGIRVETGDMVAIKEIPLAKHSAEDIERVEQEYALLQALTHPHVVNIVAFHRTATHAVVVMEWMAGGSLLDILHNFGPLPEPLLATYLKQLLSGLAFLHSTGVVHRDIKPANLLVGESGRLKLGDFGAAIRITDIQSGERSPLTPAYTAPEVLSSGQFSSSSDIWSVGCTVCQLVTGNHPWAHLDFVGERLPLIYHIVRTSDTPQMPQNASHPLVEFVQKCVSRSVEERWGCQQLMSHPFLAMREAIAAAANLEVISSPCTGNDGSVGTDSCDLSSDYSRTSGSEGA